MAICNRALLGAVLAALLAGTGAAAAATTLYGNGTQVVQYDQSELNWQQARIFDWFRHQTLYFGAFEIRPGGQGFAVRGYNKLQDAITAAHDACQVAGQGRCTLYATLTPTGFKGRRSARDGVGLGGRIYYRNAYLPNQRPGRFGAFAVSDLTQVGASWGQPSADEARTVALDACRARMEAFLARVRPAMRRGLRHSRLGHCRVTELRGG